MQGTMCDGQIPHPWTFICDVLVVVGEARLQLGYVSLSCGVYLDGILFLETMRAAKVHCSRVTWHIGPNCRYSRLWTEGSKCNNMAYFYSCCASESAFGCFTLSS